MVFVKLAGDVVQWSAWAWQHRKVFEPVLGRMGYVGDYAQAVLANPEGALRQAGNTLIFGQPDGGQRVLAYLEQSEIRAENIESAVSGLQAGQIALSTTLDSLSTVSMVTLGLSALTPAVLGIQFVALNRRLGALQKEIARLHKKFDAVIVAELKAGLDLLRQGQDLLEADERVNAQSRLTTALPYCIRTMKYFGELLGEELNQARVNRDEVRLLARHLSVAVTAVASCQVGLEQDRHAFGQSGQEMDLLRHAARWVFREAIARDPAPFLLPGLHVHGVTIEFMARLYQQARDAGALDPSVDCTVSAWFEENRRALFELRKPWRGWDTVVLVARLREAVASVEETNRVIGLSRLVEQARESGQKTLALMEQIKRRPVDDGGGAAGPFSAWAFD